MTQPQQPLPVPAPTPSLLRPPPGDCLVGLGDSICRAGDDAIYLGDSYNQWAAVLSGRMRYARNAGVGGNTTAMMLSRFDTDVAPFAPNVVTVNGGTNDFTFAVTDQQYQANVAAITAKIVGLGALPVWLTPFPVTTAGAAQKTQIYRMGTWLQTWCAARGIPCLDTLPILSDPSTNGNYFPALTSDSGTHPSAAGHFLLGTKLAAVLSGMPSASTLSASNLDPTNLVPNGMTIGTVSPWSQNWGPATGTATIGPSAIASAPGGSAMRFDLTNATGYAQMHQVITGITGGSKVRMSGYVSSTNLKVTLFATFNDAGNTQSAISLNGGDFKGVLVKDIPVPATATTLEVTMVAGVRGSTADTGHAEFSAFTVRYL